MRQRVSDFLDYFRTEEERALEEDFVESKRILDWVSQDYHKEFIRWLERESDKPIDVTMAHANLIQSAARANTFKEVLKFIRVRTERASAAVQRQRED